MLPRFAPTSLALFFCTYILVNQCKFYACIMSIFEARQHLVFNGRLPNRGYLYFLGYSNQGYQTNLSQFLVSIVTCSLSLSTPSRLAWITSVVYIGTQRIVTMTFVNQNWPFGPTHYLECHMLILPLTGPVRFPWEG